MFATVVAVLHFACGCSDSPGEADAGLYCNEAGCHTPDPGGCQDQDLEPNDSPETATSVDSLLQPHGVTLHHLEICSATDIDYFSLTLASSKSVTVRVQFPSTAGALAAAILDASSAEVAVAAAVSGGLQAQSTVGPGVFYVRVSAGPGGTLNGYDLSVTLQ